MYSFEEFKNRIREEVMVDMPEAQLEIREQTKVNDVIYTALVVKNVDSNCAPCIYLEDFYNSYIEGESINGIVKKIKNIVDTNQITVNLSWIQEWDKVKDKIYIKIINTAANNKLMQGKPCRQLLDLSIVYFVNIGHEENKEFEGTIMVQDEHLKLWNITEDMLYENAVNNMQGTATFMDIESVIMSMGVPENQADLEDMNEGYMYILSNKSHVFGAASILDDTMIDKIRNIYNKNWYMLPSSIHEWICIPKKESMEVNELKEMVQAVNKDEVSESEVLSNHVYYLDSKTGKIEIAA